MMHKIIKVIKFHDLLPNLILKIASFFTLTNSYLNILSLRLRHSKFIEKKYGKFIQVPDSPNFSRKTRFARDFNTIWVFWAQGFENGPDIVKICLNSLHKYANNFEIKLLDFNNYTKFVNIPNFIIDKYKSGKMNNTHFSDILRTYLLSEHGGMRIDATVLLTGEIPDIVKTFEVFLFKIIDDTGINSYYPNNWFLYSIPHSWFFDSMKKLLTIYWEKENYLIDYTLWHIFADMLFKKFPDYFNSIPTLLDSSAHVLQKHLFINYSQVQMNCILKTSSIHKLTYKYVSSKVEPGTFLFKILKDEI